SRGSSGAVKLNGLKSDGPASRFCVTWKLPNHRRKYPTSTATRGRICRWMLVENSQLYARVPHPNRVSLLNFVTDVGRPKLRLDHVEQKSPPLARRSCWAEFNR